MADPVPGPGRLGQRFYIAIAEPTDTAGGRSVATQAHLDWLAGCEAEGRLFLAGPFVDDDGQSTGGGLFIVRAASLGEAEALVARDPYNAGGFRTVTVRPWRLDQGAFDLTISLAQSRLRFR